MTVDRSIRYNFETLDLPDPDSFLQHLDVLGNQKLSSHPRELHRQLATQHQYAAEQLLPYPRKSRPPSELSHYRPFAIAADCDPSLIPL